MTLVLAVELTANAGGLVGQVRLSKDELSKLGVEAERAGRRASNAGRGFAQLGDRSRAAGRELGQLRNILLATVSAEAIRRTLLLADSYTAIQAQIRLATRALGDYSTASRALAGISRETGIQLGDTVGVFRAIARTAPELEATQEQVLAVTEAVQRLGVISNTAPANLRAGLQQFGQAMASQVVRAEEFNSILENIPELAERIAAGMGTTVGQLRLAVTEGDVLSRDVFRAILSQTDEIATDFEFLPRRITQSANRIRDALAESLAGLDQQLGVTGNLGAAMDGLADNMDLVVRGAVSLAAGYAAARAATLAYAAAQGAVNLVMLASPLGLIATGLGLAVAGYTAVALSTDEASDSIAAYDKAMQEAESVQRLMERGAYDLAEAQRVSARETIEAAIATTEATKAQLEARRQAFVQFSELPRNIGEGLASGSIQPGDLTGLTQTLQTDVDIFADLNRQIVAAGTRLGSLRDELKALDLPVPGSGGAAGLVSSIGDAAKESEAEVAKLLDKLREAAERGSLQVQIAGLDGRGQAVALAQFEALLAARADYAEGLRETVLLTDEERSAIEAAAGAAFDYGRQLEEIADKQRQAERAAEGLGKAAGAALLDIRRGAFDATEAVDRLIDALFQAFVIDPFQQAITDFASGFFGATPAVPAPANFSASVGRFGTVHTGGVIGQSPLKTKTADPAVFDGARRLHRGGLAANEEPVILERGEGVFTAEQMRALAPAGGVKVIINDQRGANAPEIGIEERQGAGGVRELEIWVTEAVARDIGRNGRVGKAIGTVFGATRQGVR